MMLRGRLRLDPRKRWSAQLGVEGLEHRLLFSATPAPTWAGFAENAQHTALSTVASQPLQSIHWQTPVDLDPQYVGGELFIHYGEPIATAANTVIIPVKTGATNGFRLEAINGTTGAHLWLQNTE
jgi:hypothetical protein